MTAKAVPPPVKFDGVARVARPLRVTIVILSLVKSSIAPFVVPPPAADELAKLIVPKLVNLLEGASMIHSAELKSKLEEERLGAGANVQDWVRFCRVRVAVLPDTETSACIWSPGSTGYVSWSRKTQLATGLRGRLRADSRGPVA